MVDEFNDPADPFEARLRAGLDRLRSEPDAPAVAERLGVVVERGHRRRQRRRIVSGAVVVVLAVLATVLSGLGRVDGASEHRVELGNLPGGGTLASTVTTAEVETGEHEPDSTTTTTTGIGPGDTAGPGGPTASVPGGVVSTTSPARLAPSTNRPSATTSTVSRLAVPPLPVSGCVEYESPGSSGVLLLNTGSSVDGSAKPQCHRVLRGTKQLWFRKNTDFTPLPVEIWWANPPAGAGQVLGRLPQGSGGGGGIEVGRIDDLLPSGAWTHFLVKADLGGVMAPYCDLYVVAL
jgi:hypothetical protein